MPNNIPVYTSPLDLCELAPWMPIVEPLDTRKSSGNWQDGHKPAKFVASCFYGKMVELGNDPLKLIEKLAQRKQAYLAENLKRGEL